jgi:hypothetical protein
MLEVIRLFPGTLAFVWMIFFDRSARFAHWAQEKMGELP